MQVKKRWGVVGLSLAASAVSAMALLGGCQSDSNGSSSNGGSGNTGNTGNPGSGGAGAEGGSGSAVSNGGAGPTGGGANVGGSGGGPLTCNDAPVTPIADLTNGTVGDQVNVTLEGVVAMSHKFLVSKSSSSGSCLFGVYVSAPGLTETAANSAVLVISYGDEATTDDNGNTFCAKLGEPYDANDPTGAGGNIPDWVKPGDVLTIPNGKTSHFLLSQCATEPNGSTVKAIQLATHFSGCPIEITGTAPVPAPHVLTAAELAQSADQDNAAFHNAWGAVFVRTPAVTPELWPAAECPDIDDEPATEPCLVNRFGQIQTEEGVNIGDKLYYRGYDDANLCHAGPEFEPVPESFTFVQGFHTLDFCTWGLFAKDKCADSNPKSTDCGTDATCPYTETAPPPN